MNINASEAAGLVGRHERIVRGWILAGLLKAKKAPNGRWIIKTEDLMKVKHVDHAQRARIVNWVAQQEGRVPPIDTSPDPVPAGIGKDSPTTATDIARLQLQIDGLRQQQSENLQEHKQLIQHEVAQLREAFQHIPAEATALETNVRATFEERLNHAESTLKAHAESRLEMFEDKIKAYIDAQIERIITALENANIHIRD